MSRAQNMRRWAVLALSGLVLAGLVGVPASKRGWFVRRAHVRSGEGGGATTPHPTRGSRSTTRLGRARWGVYLSWLAVWVAVMTGLVDSALTSVSFAERFSPFISRWENAVVLAVMVVAVALSLTLPKIRRALLDAPQARRGGALGDQASQANQANKANQPIKPIQPRTDSGLLRGRIRRRQPRRTHE